METLDSLGATAKHFEDLEQRRKSVLDSIATPMEKFTAREGELSEILNAGLISWDQYGRAIALAREELETKPTNAFDSVEAISWGSAEHLADLDRRAQLATQTFAGSNALMPIAESSVATGVASWPSANASETKVVPTTSAAASRSTESNDLLTQVREMNALLRTLLPKIANDRLDIIEGGG